MPGLVDSVKRAKTWPQSVSSGQKPRRAERGTASKARERKVPGIPNPPRPIRSEPYPDGLAGLTEQEHQRVLEANASYSAMVDLILFLIGLGVAVTVETPQQPFLAYEFHVEIV